MTKHFNELIQRSKRTLAKEVLPMLPINGVITKKLNPKVRIIDVGWRHPIPMIARDNGKPLKNVVVKMAMAAQNDSSHLPKLRDYPEIKKNEALDNQIWEILQSRAEHPTTRYVRGRILNSIKGGYSVGVARLIGFLPNNLSLPQQKISRSSASTSATLKTFYLELVESKTKNLVVSRKQIVEQWICKNPDWLLKKLVHRQSHKGE